MLRILPLGEHHIVVVYEEFISLLDIHLGNRTGRKTVTLAAPLALISN